MILSLRWDVVDNDAELMILAEPGQTPFQHGVCRQVSSIATVFRRPHL